MTKIKCNYCGEILEGDKKGTWKTCKCKKIYIDETKYYCRIGGNEGDWEFVEEETNDNNKNNEK